ncbi:MAG: hydroxymethylbilane synthase [bacterium]|nr:hydroxymethylbilane synthase [bacterium]MBU1917798.1 hydroxymethylbilane synthase [bacterium]
MTTYNMALSKIIIGTRASKLALWQAEHVKALIENKFSIPVSIKKISTKGDRILDRSLVEIGGKGLFLKEIEDELLAGTVDIAVHSMKDVPHEMPQGLSLVAMLERADSRDALLSDKFSSLAALPEGAVVGTTSLRRSVQLKALRPDLVFKDLRGNVDTRLKKLQKGDFDAIILAAAGLKRLGLDKHITEYLDTVPAIGQGAIGIECSEKNTELVSMIKQLNHEETFKTVSLERLYASQVNASCQTPVGCHVCVAQDPKQFQLKLFHASPDGSQAIQKEMTGTWEEGNTLIQMLVFKTKD